MKLAIKKSCRTCKFIDEGFFGMVKGPKFLCGQSCKAGVDNSTNDAACTKWKIGKKNCFNCSHMDATNNPDRSAKNDSIHVCSSSNYAKLEDARIKDMLMKCEHWRFRSGLIA